MAPTSISKYINNDEITGNSAPVVWSDWKVNQKVNLKRDFGGLTHTQFHNTILFNIAFAHGIRFMESIRYVDYKLENIDSHLAKWALVFSIKLGSGKAKGTISNIQLRHSAGFNEISQNSSILLITLQNLTLLILNLEARIFKPSEEYTFLAWMGSFSDVSIQFISVWSIGTQDLIWSDFYSAVDTRTQFYSSALWSSSDGFRDRITG